MKPPTGTGIIGQTGNLPGGSIAGSLRPHSVRVSRLLPDDSALLSRAREILVQLAKAENQQEVWAAQDQADAFLKLYGTGVGAPQGTIKAGS